MTRDETVEKLGQLVSEFQKNETDYTREDYNETQLRSDYIAPFFRLMGWDVHNNQGLPQNLREVIQEAKVKVQEKNKKPDYAFRVRGVRKYFVETKKPSVDILSHSKSSFQLRRYGWSAKLPISVLTNFKDLVIYDCRVVPREGDNPRVARLHHYTDEEFCKNFDKIYDILSRKSAFSGEFNRRYETKDIKGDRIPIDAYFLGQIASWREMLAREIITKNKNIQKDELNYLVHNFLNRLVFLRICEDRELEMYESLLKIAKSNAYNELLELFKKADEKYNSGLFNFARDRLSMHINVGDTVIIRVVQELYYPRSPYLFSVVGSNVLGDIYELFLKKEIVITKKGDIRTVEKPEAAKNKSIVTTPSEIVDEIVEKTVARKIEGKGVPDIKQLKITDICCGSGAFLLAAYQCLLDSVLNWYVKNGPERFRDRVYKGEDDLWYLSLEEKREILLDCIFGADIDENAVEVTKFGLLTKLLEGENEQTILGYNNSHGNKALPELESNVKVGNSLVDKDFFNFRKASSLSDEELYRIKPFDWNAEFPGIMKSGGFDVIVGNPPYTRIQTLSELYALELGYYRSKHSGYTCSRKDNFDKYFLFIERSLELLKRGGKSGFIIPHKFTKIKAGESLRKLISGNSYLDDIVHFGKEQVFGGKTTTYTCALTLGKDRHRSYNFETVSSFLDWKNGKRAQPFSMPSSELSENPWIFIHGPLKQLLSKLSRISKHLRDETDIYVGVQTSKDPVYIVRPEGEEDGLIQFTDWKGQRRLIERELLRPALYDLKLEPFLIPQPNSMIIFPYRINNGKAELVRPREMKTKYANTWNYLNAYKRDLQKRNIPQAAAQTWYRYGRAQSLTKFDGRKHLIIKVLSLEPTFCFDANNIVFTGGGNGPFYGISVKPGKNVDIFYIQGLLNSPLLDLYVESRSSVFRAGYFSYGKQFIVEFPLVVPDLSLDNGKAQYDKVIKLVKKLNLLVTKKRTQRIPSRIEQMDRHIRSLRDELNNLIYDMYMLTSEERQALTHFEV